MAPEDGSLCDPKHVGVKEFYMILMCFLINICMSWLLLTLILSMHGSTTKLKNFPSDFLQIVSRSKVGRTLCLSFPLRHALCSRCSAVLHIWPISC